MKVITDLHIHSKYARACSRDLVPVNLAAWADKKGINILGTGDFTHPAWLGELKENLEEAKSGLYKVKNSDSEALFMLTTELASIYKQGDKVRRVHNLVFAPNFAAVDKLIALLEKRGVNLKADGRPMMGVHCDELVRICKEADARIELIPAHAWTPHFGVFGSLSGFDSLEEAFGEEAKHIFAIETGLSSDPKMNWKVGALDNITLISNSDAHSLRKLGREANVFEIDKEKLSFSEIIRVIRERPPEEFLYTIEFFPEEGKYHLDGHADCKFSCEPSRTKELGGICPVCKKKLLRGVMARVDDLSLLPPLSWGRPGGGEESSPFPSPPHQGEGINRIPFKSIIPLEEIIADTLGVGPASKKVQAQYEAMVAQLPEFEILLNANADELTKLGSATLAESILRVRDGRVHIAGGYDGVFGKIQIYSSEEREKLLLKPKQSTLF
ncbi:MAG TPA: endonuclease Q family protein [Candidatus Doudnabacteria bacterium]|nr:endonuclease Q family protein [Candidatus Doudnabacteria bacterium]